jgi:predicted acyl esterase
MIVDKDVPITVSDGAVLRANVYRPAAAGRYPVLMAMGIYGKDVHFEDGYRAPWDKLLTLNPDIARNGSSGRYLRWELIDPERWVPDGYVVIAVDSRGSGKSQGYLDPLSPHETRDYYDAIEWAAAQDWSTRKVGLIGISYYSIKQWQVAALRPPHLAAICPWEGGSDLYRDWSHHGGILSNVFPEAWLPRQVLPNQNGNASTAHRDRETNDITTGEPLSPEMLPFNRADHLRDLLEHPLDDAWFRARSPNLPRIEVPVYSAGNWGGAGLHLRGNVEGYLRAGSKQKWLDMHVGTHFESFYLPRYIERQKKFFAHFLKGEDNGWPSEPPIRLEIRGHDGVTVRHEQEWPLARTQWQRFHLNAHDRSLARAAPDSATQVEYLAPGDGVDFSTAPFAETTEFTGPLMARLWVAATTTDLDIFASLRMFAPDGTEMVFTGASDIAPVARGWLRASHRKIDPTMSKPYRPYHAHDEIQKLVPGQVYPLDVELWPTSIVFPKGYRMVLTLSGRDLELGGVPGRILHNHPVDRPHQEFSGTVTIVSGPGRESYLLLPQIPADAEGGAK